MYASSLFYTAPAAFHRNIDARVMKDYILYRRKDKVITQRDKGGPYYQEITIESAENKRMNGECGSNFSGSSCYRTYG